MSIWLWLLFITLGLLALSLVVFVGSAVVFAMVDGFRKQRTCGHCHVAASAGATASLALPHPGARRRVLLGVQPAGLRGVAMSRRTPSPAPDQCRANPMTWRFDGPNVNPDCECPCYTCIESIGHDPEARCPDCPVHGKMTRAELEAEWETRTT